MTRTLWIATSLSLALCACGISGHDPAETSAPVAATSGASAQSEQGVAAGEPAQDYRHDSADASGATMATANGQDEALARCEGLDSVNRDACELQARQGLSDPATSPAALPTPPTDVVAPANDATAAEDDDD